MVLQPREPLEQKHRLFTWAFCRKRQIFASRYKLHLPTEEELAAELQRERRQIELVERLGRDTTDDGE